MLFVISKHHPHGHRYGSHTAAAGVQSGDWAPLPWDTCSHGLWRRAAHDLRTPGPGLSRQSSNGGSSFNFKVKISSIPTRTHFSQVKGKKNILLLTHLKGACMLPFLLLFPWPAPHFLNLELWAGLWAWLQVGLWAGLQPSEGLVPGPPQAPPVSIST